MSCEQEKRIVLDLLENGTLDPSRAEMLLTALSTAESRRRFQAIRLSPDCLVVEIDSSEENLRTIAEKLNEAIGLVTL